MLTFWGLSTKKIDLTLLQAPFLYLFISILCILISFFVARIFFEDRKERSITTIASIIGNTGNLGIPLGIALFGEGSIIYTSLINVANIFLIYTLGVFFYSRGNFNLTDSIKNIFKLPLIWFAALALLCNYFDISIHPSLFISLQMGAYASMVLQLLIFGMYMYSTKLKQTNKRLLRAMFGIKFFLIPLISASVLYLFGLDRYVFSIILLELIVPLAVTNVNIAALYDCKPLDVTALVFFSSIAFIPYIVLLRYFL